MRNEHIYDEVEMLRLLTLASEAGARKALDMITPSQEFTTRKLYSWAKRQGVKRSDIDRMIEDGTLKGKRKGTAKNSPVVYKETDAILAVKCHQNLFL